jgi:hypothetical protein
MRVVLNEKLTVSEIISQVFNPKHKIVVNVASRQKRICGQHFICY